jgi:hypothetical protein
METVRTLFNEAFAANDEVLPVDREMFAFQAHTLRPFVDSRLISFVESDARPIGFALVVPNVNELLRRFNGRIPLSALFLRRRLLQSIESIVVLLIGAVPALHGAGVGRLLVTQMISAFASSSYRVVHTTWIHQQNWASRGLARSFATRHVRRYAIYGRLL